MSGNKRERIFEIMQINRKNDRASNIFNMFIFAVILVNVSVLFLETFDELAKFEPVLKVLEEVTILIFIAEYLLRIWTADYLYPDESRGRAILRFMTSFGGIVDFCTIFPVIFFPGFIAFRMLRVIRILHLFRINARYDSILVITRVLKERKGQLVSSVFIILVLMLSSSLCMYSVEHEVQPEVFRNAFSGIWWSICTILTVGYGDIYPVTALGQLLAIVISFLGVGVVAIPTGIISSGFVELIQHHEGTEGGQGTADAQDTAVAQRIAGVQGTAGAQDAAVARGTAGARGAAIVQGTSSVLVGKSSPLCGKTVEEAQELHHVCVVALVREGAVILPGGSLEIEEGEALICQTRKGQAS